MKKNLRLILLIPLIIFFASILVILFSPARLLPCETSPNDPATSWESSKCKGYYLTINPQEGEKVNVNSSGFLINLAILVCGSFLFNGIFFLLLFIVVSLQKKPMTELEKWDEVADIAEHALERETEELEKPKRKLFRNPFKKKKDGSSDTNEFNI